MGSVLGMLVTIVRSEDFDGSYRAKWQVSEGSADDLKWTFMSTDCWIGCDSIASEGAAQSSAFVAIMGKLW